MKSAVTVRRLQFRSHCTSLSVLVVQREFFIHSPSTMTRFLVILAVAALAVVCVAVSGEEVSAVTRAVLEVDRIYAAQVRNATAMKGTAPIETIQSNTVYSPEVAAQLMWHAVSAVSERHKQRVVSLIFISLTIVCLSVRLFSTAPMIQHCMIGHVLHANSSAHSLSLVSWMIPRIR